jgi:hypothetical protein
LRNKDFIEGENLLRYDAIFADNFVKDVSVEFAASIFKVIEE